LEVIESGLVYLLGAMQFTWRLLLVYLGPSSLPVVVAQPDERPANGTASVLDWHDMTDTEHATSGSNEEEEEIFLPPMP